jgi:hypothetical protein
MTETKEIIHPLEAAFNIEEGTTIIEYEEPTSTALVKHEEYDEKDVEIEDQFQEVYDKAMDAFEAQSDITEQVEGKFAARNAEVASVFLNTALNAAKEKSGQKEHKDKLAIAKKNVGKPDTVNNNLIMDRNDLLRMLNGEEEPIKDITNETE